jgi:hypothetical protein
MNRDGCFGLMVVGMGNVPPLLFGVLESVSCVYSKGRLLSIVLERSGCYKWLLIYSLDDWDWILRMKFGTGGDLDINIVPSFYEPIRCIYESLMIGGDLIAVEEVRDSRWILVYRKESAGFVLASEFRFELIDY